jgi:hypothetical protein
MRRRENVVNKFSISTISNREKGKGIWWGSAHIVLLLVV